MRDKFKLVRLILLLFPCIIAIFFISIFLNKEIQLIRKQKDKRELIVRIIDKSVYENLSYDLGLPAMRFYKDSTLVFAKDIGEWIVIPAQISLSPDNWIKIAEDIVSNAKEITLNKYDIITTSILLQTSQNSIQILNDIHRQMFLFDKLFWLIIALIIGIFIERILLVSKSHKENI